MARARFKRGDVVEYVGEGSPWMKGAIGVVKCVGCGTYFMPPTVDIAWIYLPRAGMSAMEVGWLVENLRALHPQQNTDLYNY